MDSIDNKRLLVSIETGKVLGVAALRVTLVDDLISTSFCVPVESAISLAQELIESAEEAKKETPRALESEDSTEERPS